MSNINDFIIEDGVLKKYVGTGGEVVIPDGVKEIGLEALGRRVVGAKGVNTITIPKTVKLIRSGAINCDRWHPIKFNMSINCPYWSVYPHSFLNSDNSTITFYDNDKIVAKIVFAITNEPFSKRDKAYMSVKSFKKGGFDFATYDNFWSELTQTENKIKIAAVRIRYPYKLPNKMKNVYLSYLKRNSKIVGKLLIDNEDLESLSVLAQQGVFTSAAFTGLVEYSNEVKKPTVTAYLLELKNNYDSDKKDNTVVNEKKVSGNTNISECKALFSYKNIGGDIIIMGYKGDKKNVIIPENIGDYRVAAIDDYAFSPFANRLTEEKKRNRVNIESVIVPKSVKSIGYGAFYGCSNLKKIVISSPSVKIGSLILKSCTALEDVIFESEKYFYKDKLLFGKRGKEILCCCGDVDEVDIPKGVERICDYAFSYSNISIITLPDSMKSIGWGAFYFCEHLNQIVIPDGLTAINQDAFAYCSRLERIYLHKDFKRFSQGLFASCNSLTIYAPADSYAETYAKKNNIPFVEE